MSVRMLVVGSANMDFVMNCERLPCAGETMLSYEPYEYAGAERALILRSLQHCWERR